MKKLSEKYSDISKENLQRAYDKGLIWYTVLQTIGATALVSVNNPYTGDGTVSLDLDKDLVKLQGSDYVLDAFYDFLCENPEAIERI